MNLEKIAKLANVSLGTVSKAFSGSKEISSETRNKIFKIAKENGCYDKYVKRKSENKVVALICPEIKSAFYADTVAYLQEKLNENNILTNISLSYFSAKTESELISYYSAHDNADGIILIGNYSNAKFNKDVPIVALGKSRNNEIDSISSDDGIATREAIELFMQNGHKKIAFIGENFTKGYEKKFVSILEEKGLEIYPEYIICEKERFETAGFNGMNKLIAMSNRPTAVLCAYDYIAFGAIQAIRQAGLSVPEDFSVIGSDNISFASYYNISLTTIDKKTKDSCDVAVDLMLKKLNNKYYMLRQNISIRAELKIRNSVKDITN